MPDVTFSVASRRYTLRCAAGQEGHLQQLAALLDQRVQPLVSAVPGADDRQLLVIAAIALLDELQAARSEAPAAAPEQAASSQAASSQVEESAGLRSMAESLQSDCEALRAENSALRLWAESMSGRLTALSGSLGGLVEVPPAD